MRWDEDGFGLEYDLDLFNIVAVDDFNMGAMENKSLNIFNLAAHPGDAVRPPRTAVRRIEGVVATSTSTTGPATASRVGIGFSSV